MTRSLNETIMSDGTGNTLFMPTAPQVPAGDLDLAFSIAQGQPMAQSERMVCKIEPGIQQLEIVPPGAPAPFQIRTWGRLIHSMYPEQRYVVADVNVPSGGAPISWPHGLGQVPDFVMAVPFEISSAVNWAVVSYDAVNIDLVNTHFLSPCIVRVMAGLWSSLDYPSLSTMLTISLNGNTPQSFLHGLGVVPDMMVVTPFALAPPAPPGLPWSAVDPPFDVNNIYLRNSGAASQQALVYVAKTFSPQL